MSIYNDNRLLYSFRNSAIMVPIEPFLRTLSENKFHMTESLERYWHKAKCSLHFQAPCKLGEDLRLIWNSLESKGRCCGPPHLLSFSRLGKLTVL